MTYKQIDRQTDTRRTEWSTDSHKDKHLDKRTIYYLLDTGDCTVVYLAYRQTELYILKDMHTIKAKTV